MRAAPILAILMSGGSLHGQHLLRRGCCGRCEVPGQDLQEVRSRAGAAGEAGGRSAEVGRKGLVRGRGEAQAKGTQEPIVKCK